MLPNQNNIVHPLDLRIASQGSRGSDVSSGVIKRKWSGKRCGLEASCLAGCTIV
jgi:hypothetical protein